MIEKADRLNPIDFFTRELADGYRPTADPDDDSVIINACESKSVKPLSVILGNTC